MRASKPKEERPVFKTGKAPLKQAKRKDESAATVGVGKENQEYMKKLILLAHIRAQK